MSGPPKIVVWEWEIEFQGWRPYSGPVSTFIEHHYKNNKHNSRTLPLGNADPKLASFYIDLQNMEQIGLANTPVKHRKIRRQLFPTTSPIGQGILWEWSGDGHNEWLSYDLQALFILENAFLNGMPKVDLSQSPTFIPYTINLQNMIQEQIHTGFKRRVRRSLNACRYPLDMPGPIPPPFNPGLGPPLNNSILGQFSSANTLPSSSYSQLNGSQSTQQPPPPAATFVSSLPLFPNGPLLGQGPSAGLLAPVVPSNSAPTTSNSGNPHNNPLNLKKNYSKTNSAATNNLPPKRRKQSHQQPQFIPLHQIPVQNHFNNPLLSNGATNFLHRPIFGAQANQLPGGSVNQGPMGGPSILGLPPPHNGFPMAGGAMLKPPPAHQGAPPPHMAYNLSTGLSHTVRSISENDAATVLMQFVKIVIEPPKDDDCPICCEGLCEDSGYAEKKTNSDPAVVVGLKKCGHFFHKMCLEAMYDSGTKDGSLQCPTCKAIYGEKHGNCPPGRMEYDTINQSLPGHPGCGTIRIIYHITPGRQGPSHPNPGFPFKARGFPRQGFLPDNEKGRKVLKMLIKAWERKLTFTIGTSSTTGENDCVIWNEIHHKTEFGSNHSGHGYPDPNYLDNVTLELIAQGVTEDDIEP